MCAETINETVNVCKYLGSKQKVKNIDGDVILQDIKPDILSIVKISRKVCITSKKVEDGKIRINGFVDAGIIYIADDDTNSQRGISSQIDFSEVMDFEGVDENSIVIIKYCVGNVEYKVINGRKISINVPVTFYIKAFNNCDINIIKGIMDDSNIQMQRVNQNICGPIMRNTSEIQIKENVKLNENNCPIGELLNCSMVISNKEYKLSYNKILAKADAKIKIVYIADNERQNVETFETVLPVMGFIDAEGINENSKVSLEYEIKNYCIKPTYQDLQAKAISVEANIDVIAYSCDNREVELVTDFYTPMSIINMETENNNVVKSLIDVDECIELSQTLVVPELDNTTILNIDGIVSVNEKNILNGKIAISGNVNVNVLFSKNDSRMMENKRLELPFQQVIKVENLSKDMEPIVNIECENIEYNVVGENQIQVNINLIATIVADEEENINSITKVDISNENIPIMPSMIVYYVKAGDTLWNIAKNFRNTVDYIKDINDLKDDTIYPGQRLLIPRLQIENKVNTLM